MNLGFWEKLNKPFFALAPMADVTDPAFRILIAKYSRFTHSDGTIGGGPDVMWTEFVSADGLASAGREVLKRDLAFTENERPIVAQLFSSHPDKMRIASKLVAEMGFDGIDINMGCPDKSIEGQGSGACMIKTPEIAGEIIQAVKDGIADAGKTIPVSVKTRVGYNQVEIDSWIPFLLSQDIACLSVHARTRKEMSKVPAHWEYIKEIVAIRDRMKVNTLIVGNGDVRDMEHGRKLAKETGCDGVMIGRAIFGNPWLFSTSPQPSPVRRGREALGVYPLRPSGTSPYTRWRKALSSIKIFFRSLFGLKHRYWLEHTDGITTKQKLDVLIEHAELFEQLLGDYKNFAIMKKHFKAYVHGFAGSKELRMQLMEQGNSATKVRIIIEEFLKKY